MTQPEDRDWERLLERVDLEMSDADLAAAEEELRRLTSEDVVPVRAEWVDAAVAKARELPIAAAAAAAAERAPLALVRRPRFGGLQRLAAAVLAFLGLHSTAAAAVGVTAVVGVAAVVIWKAGRNSNETMSFHMALEISLRADQSDEERLAALKKIGGRLRSAVDALQKARVEDNSELVREIAAARLDSLRFSLDGAAPASQPQVEDTVQSSMETLLNPSAPVADRIHHAGVLGDLAAVGIAVFRGMSGCSPDVEAARLATLDKLLALLRQ